MHLNALKENFFPCRWRTFFPNQLVSLALDDVEVKDLVDLRKCLLAEVMQQVFLLTKISQKPIDLTWLTWCYLGGAGRPRNSCLFLMNTLIQCASTCFNCTWCQLESCFRLQVSLPNSVATIRKRRGSPEETCSHSDFAWPARNSVPY